ASVLVPPRALRASTSLPGETLRATIGPALVPTKSRIGPCRDCSREKAGSDSTFRRIELVRNGPSQLCRSRDSRPVDRAKQTSDDYYRRHRESGSHHLDNWRQMVVLHRAQTRVRD